MAQVKVTLTRSLIGRPEDQRATVKALGLKKTNSQIVKEVTPQIEGMLDVYKRQGMNIFDLLHYDKLFITKGAVAQIEEVLG